MDCICWKLWVDIIADWLQPYKHIEYSAGVIYILNLPHSIRFKSEM